MLAFRIMRLSSIFVICQWILNSSNRRAARKQVIKPAYMHARAHSDLSSSGLVKVLGVTQHTVNKRRSLLICCDVASCVLSIELAGQCEACRSAFRERLPGRPKDSSSYHCCYPLWKRTIILQGHILAKRGRNTTLSAGKGCLGLSRS